MGSDIHIFLEKNTSLNGVSKWVNIDYWKLNPYYDGVNEYEDEYEHVSVYRGRDYTLFNILAGVRGTGHDMIDDPRGVPEDISPLIKKQYEKWSSDGHSHSYFTLFELKEFLGKNPTIKYRGMVEPEDAEKLDKGEGTPNMWCEWSNEKLGWVYREWDEPTPLKYLVEKVNKRFQEEFHIYDDNRHPEKEKSFRVIFWFDN